MLTATAANAAEWLSSGSEVFGLAKLLLLIAVVSLGVTALVRYIAEHGR